MDRCFFLIHWECGPLRFLALCRVQGIETGRRSQSSCLPLLDLYPHFQFPGTEIQADRFPKAYKMLQSSHGISSHAGHWPLWLSISSSFLAADSSSYIIASSIIHLNYIFYLISIYISGDVSGYLIYYVARLPNLFVLWFFGLFGSPATGFVLFWWWWWLQRSPIVSLAIYIFLVLWLMYNRYKNIFRSSV